MISRRNKFLYGSLILIVLSSLITIRGFKNKTDFEMVRGKVEYLHCGDFGTDCKYSNVRYLKVDTYSKEFRIFIGKETGDITPKFEQLDSLKAGDVINVYYDENFLQSSKKANKLVQYIDKDSKPYFIKGHFDGLIGLILFFVGLSLFIYLARKKQNN